MIAVDELNSTLKRLELLHDNTESPEERVLVRVLMQSILPILQQVEIFVKSPQYQQLVEEEKKGDGSTSPR